MSALDLQPTGELYCPTCEKAYASGERCPNDNTRLVRLARRADNLIGRELDGRYTIIDRIGEGGMGTVYRGKQHSVGRECAIKVVNPNLVREPVAIKRFLREAKLASRLAHPNAVAVLDFGQTDDGLFFLVMELVNGRTLDRVLEEDRELAPSRVARIGTQICDALEGAHALDIVHRDLKPANVMIISTGRDLVKVLDFGLAKSLSPDAASNKTTNAGALLGTPAYMPPELVSGGAVDGRADLYSLGCVLYQAASGRLPFWSENVHDLVAMHVSARPPKLAGVPRRLAQVIEKMLAKAPGDRFGSAAHAREALEAAVNMIPDTLDESPGFGSTMLGWAGRARSDTLKSIEPPSHVSFGTPEPTSNPDLEATDPSVSALPRTPVNVSTAWEGPATPPPSDHGGELAHDTVRVHPGPWADGATTPIPWPGNRVPPARGSAQIVEPPADAGRVLQIVRVNEPAQKPKGSQPPPRLGSPIPPMKQAVQTGPQPLVTPKPAPAAATPTASATLDLSAEAARRRTLMLAMIAVGVAIVLGTIVYLLIGRDAAEPPPPPPKPTAAAPSPAEPRNLLTSPLATPPPAPVGKPAPIVTPLPAPPPPAKAAVVKPESAPPARAAVMKPEPAPPARAAVVKPAPPPPAKVVVPPPASPPPAQAPPHESPTAPPAAETPPPAVPPSTDEPSGNPPP